MQKIQIAIPVPCHEDWEKMSATQQGRSCNACAKEVIDLSEMTDAQVLNYFTANAFKKICGRTHPDQLNRTIAMPARPKKKIAWYWKYAAALFLFFARSNISKAQKKDPAEVINILPQGKRQLKEPDKKQLLVSGRVIDRSGHGIPNAAVIIKNSTTGVSTNANGDFKIRVEQTAALLQISAIGFTSALINIPSTNNLTITLKPSKLEMMTMGIIIVDEDELWQPGSISHVLDLKVYDSTTLRPVANAQILIAEDDPVRTNKYLTEKNGQCKIRKISEENTYVINISAAGYKDTSITVSGAYIKKRKLKQKIFLIQKEIRPAYKETGHITVEAQHAVNSEISFTKQKITASEAKVNYRQERVAAAITKPSDILKAFPNPLQRGGLLHISLQLKQPGNYTMQVTDLPGKILFTTDLVINAPVCTQQIQADKSWSAGVYYISIFDEKSKLISKGSFVIQ